MAWDIEGLFRRHAGAIARALRRRGHTPETAADLTQDAFVRLMNASPEGAGDNSSAYLYQIARNLSIDLNRRAQRVDYTSMPDEALAQIADPSPSQEDVVYDRERLAIVERALHELPLKTRRAFEMYRLGERTLSEVGAELNLSTTRTWTLIRQAYLHLRARLHGDSP